MNTSKEREALTIAMRNTTDKRLYERYLAVRLHLEERTFTEIASIIGRTYQTISTYWKAYDQDGLVGLKIEYAPGRLPKLSEQEQQELAEMLTTKQPVDVGYEAKYTWTLKLIVAWIEREFGASFTPRGASILLHRLGFSYTKATYTLARADENEQAFFRDHTFPDLKKQLLDDEIAHLLFEDESMIRDYQALQYNWFPKGQQRKIVTHGRHQGAKLFGAINYETGHVTHREEEQADTEAFQRFLADIVREYPEGKIVLLLDNSRIHHDDKIQPFLQEHPRLRLVFLPKYSPNLNLIEGLWKWLKSDVVNNVFFNKFYYIRTHVRTFMRRINQHPDEVIDRLLVRL